MKMVCELCERENVETTVHHLTPREEGGSHLPTANLCISCHKQIHALFTNRELANGLHTIENLRSNERVYKYLKWIKKQPSTSLVRIKKSNEKRSKQK